MICLYKLFILLVFFVVFHVLFMINLVCLNIQLLLKPQLNCSTRDIGEISTHACAYQTVRESAQFSPPVHFQNKPHSRCRRAFLISAARSGTHWSHWVRCATPCMRSGHQRSQSLRSPPRADALHRSFRVAYAKKRLAMHTHTQTHTHSGPPKTANGFCIKPGRLHATGLVGVTRQTRTESSNS